MKADVYGSRSLMMKLVEFSNELNLELVDSFIGTNLISQKYKDVPISQNRMKRIISEYEYIEIKTDLSKRFRRFKDFKESNVIFIDFMHEGKDLISVHNGNVVNRPVLKRYGYDTSKATISKLDRVINIEKDIANLMDYTANYKKIVLIKMRNPKYFDKNGRKILKEDFHEINKLNSFAEMCEDLLISKIPDIDIVDLHKEVNDLRDGYLKTEEYQEHLKQEIKTILSKYKIYL